MKISTAHFFRSNANAMSKGQFDASSLQARLGSGKQLTFPSEDPSKANLIARLESSVKRESVYQQNIGVAKTRLTSEETALTSITELFQRASEIALIGANGTMAADDRAVFAAEVSEIRKELIRLGNSKDVNGEYIFAGNNVDEAPFVEADNGDVSYNGDNGRLKINISDSRAVAINTLGNELLRPEEFSAIRSLEQGLSTNNESSIRSSIDEIKDASDRISVSFGKMAGRFSSLNTQEELLEDTALRIERLISENKDLDYAKAITELSRETLALQALQASFTKIAQLTLFNFMR